LPYETPEEVIPEEIEVDGDVEIDGFDDSEIQLDDDGQITLF
jgi:topoisomerase-4 subunit A